MQNNTKLTINPLSIGHVLLSAGVAVLVTILITVVQYLGTNHISLDGLLTVLGVAFAGAVGKQLVTLEKNPEVIQTVQHVEDTLAQHASVIGQLLSQHASVISQLLTVGSNLVNQAASARIAPLQSQQTPIPLSSVSQPIQSQQPVSGTSQPQFQRVSMPGMTQYAPLPDVSMPLAAMPSSQPGQVSQR